MIQVYQTDNGIFNASELSKNQNNIRLSGPSVSDQNGAEDCAINMVVTIARTMLMYAVLRCPEVALYTYI